MAWKWPGSSSNGNGEEWTGFIDQGVSLEGTLTLTGTFRIDGRVKGNIISEQTVVLGENAKVEGQIEGNRVVIAGRFDGVIFAKGRVEIQAKGVVTGEVHSPVHGDRSGRNLRWSVPHAGIIGCSSRSDDSDSSAESSLKREPALTYLSTNNG